MATGTTSSNDREYLFRLQTLIIDGGTDVLRNIFDQKVQQQNVPLNVFLANEKKLINRLRGQKTITTTQYHKLYPPGGQHPNSADFDITLIICLLRNLPSLGLNPNYSWNVPPQPVDTSIEADLCRLKGFRNEVAHIASTTGFQQTSFQTKWTEIEQVLLRLNQAVVNPVVHLKQTIDSYKNDSLDPAAEKRIQADIQQWKKMEKGLETEMLHIKKNVNEVTEDVKEVRGGVKTISENVEEVNLELKNVKGNIVKVKEDIDLVKKDVQTIKEVTQDINVVKERVGEIKGNVVEVKHEVENVKEHIEKVKEDTELVKKDVQTIKEVTQDINVVKKNVGEVEDIVEEVQLDVTSVRKDIVGVKDDIGGVKEKVEGLLKEQKETVEMLKERQITKIDEDYRHLKTQLQDDLISFYRRQHSKITLSPLVDEDTPLLEFYIMPDINSLEVKRVRGGGKEEMTPLSSFRNVFYKKDELCSEIYLTADAGLGKTALCKRLALAWCHAKKPLRNEKRYFSKEEIEVMNEFRFIFLLLLRDCAGQCDIDDMIMTQIVSQLGHRYDSEYLENIMCKEKCLVISDGLDEWTHPANSCKQVERNIPHRKARDCTAVLTTTRPWRLNASGLKPSDIDQRLEITGLNQKSAFMLKRSVISHLRGEKNERMLENNVANFTRAVNEKQISDLEAIPLLLMYLLFLWYYGIELGRSQCDLYSKFIELLLSRTVLKYKDTSSLVEPTQGDIPQCFSTQTRCRQFYSLLTALGHLAFQTLFKETREENTLVFDSSVAEQYLNKDCLTFCLSTGIITQSKVQGNPMKQESKVSFAHKTVQEFLAALYMHSAPDHTSVSEIVASKCKCVKDVLDMSKVLKFIIGININVASSISRELMKIINEDEITREYRNTPKDITTRYFFVSHPLKDFQDMCISCCEELPRENEVSLCLQDVFIKGSCKQEQYREHLKQLTTRNTQNIRSLYIDMFYMEDTPYNSVQKVVEYFAINGLENIEKIHCQGGYNERTILPLLNRSFKCLSLSCKVGHKLGSWSRLLGEKVASLQKLEAIKISVVAMSHSEWTLLCDYISHRHCMRQIVLELLYCTNHGKHSCTGASLDLSQHSQLSELTLDDISVRTVNVNMAALEKCCLWELYNRDLVLRFVNCDPADSKLNKFTCRGLQSRAAIDTILDTLPGLHQVKHVELGHINLGDRKLKLSPEMKNLERVVLHGVTMAASSLRGVVDCVDKLPQTVEVDIERCTITPEREFVTVRDKIKTSPRFRVTEDSKDWRGITLLKFVIIKYGD